MQRVVHIQAKYEKTAQMQAKDKGCLYTTKIVIEVYPSRKEFFTMTKSRKSINLSIIVKGIV